MNNRDVVIRNSKAWDLEAEKGHWATKPITKEHFLHLKKEGFPISLTGKRPIPDAWLGDLTGKKVLCIACGGGQQSVLLAAKGAHVTSIENSPEQLNRDIVTSASFGLEIEGILGSMDDPRVYPNKKFDLVILGMGSQFVLSLDTVFPTAFDRLSDNGCFIGSFVNPICYIFDWESYELGQFVVRHKIPYSDLESITETERLKIIGVSSPLELGHSLEHIFGGLNKCGGAIVG